VFKQKKQIFVTSFAARGTRVGTISDISSRSSASDDDGSRKSQKLQYMDKRLVGHLQFEEYIQLQHYTNLQPWSYVKLLPAIYDIQVSVQQP